MWQGRLVAKTCIISILFWSIWELNRSRNLWNGLLLQYWNLQFRSVEVAYFHPLTLKWWNFSELWTLLCNVSSDLTTFLGVDSWNPWNFWIVRMWSATFISVEANLRENRFNSMFQGILKRYMKKYCCWLHYSWYILIPRDDVYCLAWNRRWSYDKERLDRSLRPSNGSACTMRSHWPWQCWWAASTIFWGHFEASLNVTIFNSPCWLIPFKVWLISYQLIVKSYDLSVKNATS